MLNRVPRVHQSTKTENDVVWNWRSGEVLSTFHGTFLALPHTLEVFRNTPAKSFFGCARHLGRCTVVLRAGLVQNRWPA